MKKLIVIILIVLLIGSLFFVLKGSNKNVVGTKYEYPLLESVSYKNGEFLINAGNYLYGDITEDGIINELDLMAIDLIITDNFKYSDGQKILADLNLDNVVDNKDKKLLSKYIENNKVSEYDYYSNLMYCINKDDDINTCEYQESNYFYNVDFSIEYYYITIKNIETNKVNTYKYGYQ